MKNYFLAPIFSVLVAVAPIPNLSHSSSTSHTREVPALSRIGSTVEMTDVAGFRWSVSAGSPTEARSFSATAPYDGVAVAPRGFDYIKVPLTISNQGKRPASLTNLIADGNSGSVYLGVPTSEFRDVPATGIPCQEGTPGAISPRPLCFVGAQSLMPNGYDVSVNSDPNQDGYNFTVLPGSKIVIHEYLGPVSKAFNDKNAVIVFQLGPYGVAKYGFVEVR